jgi:acetyltransferase
MVRFRVRQRWLSANGTLLTLRRMRPGDATMVKWGLERVSAQARRNRFFAAIGEISDQLVRRLTEVDPRREYALLVVRKSEGADSPVAGGRIVVDEDHAGCQFSLLVGDDWQGQGIGQRLLRALVDEAGRRRLRRIEGHVYADNRAMLRLARSLGFQVTDSAEGSAVKLVRLELDQMTRGWKLLA